MPEGRWMVKRENGLLDALLFAPDVHDGVHRQELDQAHLPAHRVAENGDALFFLRSCMACAATSSGPYHLST